MLLKIESSWGSRLAVTGAAQGLGMLPNGDVAVIYKAVLCVVLQPQESDTDLG